MVAYIRPAKKLTLLLCCACLYLAQRHARERSRKALWSLVVWLYVSFFADEMALLNYVIVAILFFPSLFRDAPSWKRYTLLSLPIMFLIAVGLALPTIYSKLSVHGPWDALQDKKKIELTGYLVDYEFYLASLTHTARAVLTTIGVETHTRINEIAGLAVLTGGVALAYRLRRVRNASTVWYGLLASTASLFAAGLYATLLDWYPFRKEVSYLGSFTFYYHSSLGLLVILWLAFAWEMLLVLARSHPAWRQAIVVGGVFFASLVTASNFAMFHDINRLVQLIHTYPYSSEAIH